MSSAVFETSDDSRPVMAHRPRLPKITFAPTLTPTTYPASTLSAPTSPGGASDRGASPLSAVSASGSGAGAGLVRPLFPPASAPSDDDAAPAPRPRAPHSKKRPENHIPRPPNSFILFRSEFIRSQHVPGTIESNHGSLSKIIGVCWRNLSFEERAIWEARAKVAQAEHKARYPHYRFRPQQAAASADGGRTPTARRARAQHTLAPAAAEYAAREEQKVEDVAMLLLEGKRGAELEDAVRDLERQRAAAAPPRRRSHSPAAPPARRHRRASSVPLPANGLPPPPAVMLPPPSCPASPAPAQLVLPPDFADRSSPPPLLPPGHPALMARTIAPAPPAPLPTYANPFAPPALQTDFTSFAPELTFAPAPPAPTAESALFDLAAWGQQSDADMQWQLAPNPVVFPPPAPELDFAPSPVEPFAPMEFAPSPAEPFTPVDGFVSPFADTRGSFDQAAFAPQPQAFAPVEQFSPAFFAQPQPQQPFAPVLEPETKAFFKYLEQQQQQQQAFASQQPFAFDSSALFAQSY